MKNEPPTLEEIAGDEKSRRAVVNIIYTAGLEEEDIIEIVGNFGIPPETVEEDLLVAQETCSPTAEPYTQLLRIYAAVITTQRFQDLNAQALSLLQEVLYVALGFQRLSDYFAGALNYALYSKHGRVMEVELDFDIILLEFFTNFMTSAENHEQTPRDIGDMEMALLVMVDPIVTEILAQNANTPQRPVEGPLTRRPPEVPEG